MKNHISRFLRCKLQIVAVLGLSLIGLVGQAGAITWMQDAKVDGYTVYWNDNITLRITQPPAGCFNDNGHGTFLLSKGTYTSERVRDRMLQILILHKTTGARINIGYEPAGSGVCDILMIKLGDTNSN